jgi:hypothetical protein
MMPAVRALAARPGFTTVAVLTLALGFGVNAAIFSLTRTALLRPLPYRDVDRLVLVGEASPSRGVSYSAVAPANYVAWRERVTAFEETAAWRFVYFTLSGRIDPPIRVQGVIAVYGVISYLATARTREIAIRMALGASRRDVVSMIIVDAMKFALSGSAVGAVLSPMVMSVERSWIAGIDRSHPAATAAVVVLLLAVCVVAAAIPARRAASTVALPLR